MNAIVIEQSAEEMKLAFEVHRHSSLSSIRLSTARFLSVAGKESAEIPIAVTFNRKSRGVPGPPDVLRLEIAFRMAGVERKAEGEKAGPPVVSVECIYEVDYALRKDFQLTPDHVKSFKDGNAIFNAWPYFREFLQSSLQRMGFPALTAPFLRIQPKLAPAANEAVQDTPRAKIEGGKKKRLAVKEPGRRSRRP